MVIKLILTVDDSKLKGKLKGLVRWGSIELTGLTKKQADEGASHARTLAPVYPGSGALLQAIATAPGRGGRGNISYSILSRLPKNKDGRKRPYHLMMHGLMSPNISSRIHRGEPDYMYRTATYLGKAYPEKVKISLKRKLRQLK